MSDVIGQTIDSRHVFRMEQEVRKLRGEVAAWKEDAQRYCQNAEYWRAERDAAIEVMERVHADLRDGWSGDARDMLKAAIDAARSEAALDRMAQDAREQGLDYEPDAAKGGK